MKELVSEVCKGCVEFCRPESGVLRYRGIWMGDCKSVGGFVYLTCEEATPWGRTEKPDGVGRE